MKKICDLVLELKKAVRFQELIEEFSYRDFSDIIKNSIERLYVDTSRATEYSDELYIIDPTDNQEYYNGDMSADEHLYVMCLSKMSFYNIIKDNYSAMTSFTTNAISVTQGDKPYANLNGICDALETERRRIFYKLARFNTIED